MHKLQGTVSRLLIAISIAVFPAISAFGETPISDPIITRGAGVQGHPASATDGRDFLLVWTDWRSGTASIYATRVTAAGVALDPEGILLSDPNERAEDPAVAWAGSSYIVAWRQDGCRFRWVARDGHLQGSPLILFRGSYSSPQIATLGDRAIVVADHWYQGIDVAAIANVWPFFRMLDGVRDGWNPRVACSDSECLIAWQGYKSIKGRRVDRYGSRLGLQDRVLATEAMDPVVAATGERFLLAWRDWNEWDSRSTRLWARELRLDSDSESTPFVVTKTDEPAILDAVVTPSRNGFLVAWSQYHQKVPIDRRPDIRVDTVAQSESVIELRARRIGDGEEELTISSNIANQPVAVASNGVTHLGAWIEASNGKIAASVLQDEASRTPIAVTRSATRQTDPHVVNCRDHLLVVWSEELQGDGKTAIMARRFRFSGEALDTHPIVIADAAETQQQPIAAFDGQSYLIAWSDYHRVYARELHRDGTFATDVLALSSEGAYGEQPAVVAMDRGFAVLHGDGDWSHQQVILTRLGAGAAIERTTIAGFHNRDYALGWNGSELIAVWADGREHIDAARVTPAGLPLDPQPFRVAYGGYPGGALILCEASECVVAWTESGVNAAMIVGGTALSITEPFRDLSEYRPQPTERYGAIIVRRDGEFQLISYGSGGTLYSRSLRGGIASPETTIGQAPTGIQSYSLAYTPNGFVQVYSRPVFGPGYAGAQRLFLGYLPN